MKYTKKFAVALLAVTMLAGCSAPADPAKTQQVASTGVGASIAVRTQKAATGGLALEGEFIGTIMPGETVNIMSTVMGVVDNIHVKEGDYVRKGQVLFTIEDDSVRAQMDKAVVGLETTQINKEQGLFNASTSANNAQLSHDQLLISQEQALFNATNAVTNAENSVERLKLAKDQAIKQAENGIANAKSGYEQTLLSHNQAQGGKEEISDMTTDKAIEDLEEQIDGLDKNLYKLENNVNYTYDLYSEAQDTIRGYASDKADLQAKLAAAQAAGSDTSSIEASITRLEERYAKAQANQNLYYVNYLEAESVLKAAKDNIDKLEETLEHQKDIADITNTQIKEEAQAIMDEQIAKAEMAIQQAEEGLVLTIENYDLQIEQAEEALQTAIDTREYTQRTLEGQLNQSATGVASAQDSILILEDIYNAQLENAQLGIDSTQLQLDQYKVESPISGIIEKLTLVEDTMVSNSAVIATVSDYSTMEVVFYVGEKVKSEMKLGQTVEFELEGKVYQGKVNEIGNVVDPNTKLFKVTALVDSNEAKFSNGVTVRLTTGTFEETETIIIPYDAVIFSNGTAYVYKVVDGKAVKQDVEIGLFTEDTISIISGLTPEDEVITTWSEGLRDGVAVEITE